MDHTADRAARRRPLLRRPLGRELRRDPDRMDDARRMTPREVGTRRPGAAGRVRRPAARHAVEPDLAAHRRAGRRRRVRAGPRRGRAGDSPLEESLCTVTAAGGGPLVVPDAADDDRVRDLPPGHLGPGRRLPRRPADRPERPGHRHALRVRPRRRGSGRTPTSRRCAGWPTPSSPSSSCRRWCASTRATGCAGAWPIDAAGIGTFDWDLVTGQLAWDDRLIAHVRLRRRGLRPEHRGVQRPAAPRRPAAGHRRAAGLHRHLRRVRVGVPRRPSRTARPAGCTPAAGPCAARTAPPSGSSARPTTPPASGPAPPA